eukprot:COSAG01_NODE_32595_length_578_cov_3.210856_1_plen_100_part_01
MRRCCTSAPNASTAAPDDLRDLNTARDGQPFRRMFHWPHVARKCGTGLNVEELTKHAEQMRRGVGAYSELARWRDVIRSSCVQSICWRLARTVFVGTGSG